MLPSGSVIASAASPGVAPPLVMILPFVAMLLSISVLPFFLKGFCDRYYRHVAVALGAIPVAYYAFAVGDLHPMLEAAHEYISFIVLIGSLFVVSGGIHIVVKGEAKPWMNCLFLFIGSVLANVVGTTGASMLMIRPWIRMNKYRITGYHIVFFIFIVSNAGGLLTPIGDPPLFLGFLKGVPFWWVLQHCWKAWLVSILWLVGIFYVIDRMNFRRAPREIRESETASQTWRFDGMSNLLFLAVILGAVFVAHPPGLRELLMIGAAAASYWTTPKPVHQANDFLFHPMKEVAWLFAGIFATMVPALSYLEQHSRDLGLDSPMQFYWLTGVLSAILDNAPTYLAFLSVAFGAFDLSVNNPEHMTTFIAANGNHLLAISLGAVLFGAATYIGNGPNFMVKSIAEHAKVETPDFICYLWKYSLPILLPLFVLIAVLFLR